MVEEIYHIEIVKFLLASKIKILNQDALNLSVYSNHIEVVKLLIDYEPDILNGKALIYAVKNNNFEMVKLLVDYGVDVFYKNEKALNIAQKQGYQDIVDYISNAQIPCKNPEENCIFN